MTTGLQSSGQIVINSSMTLSSVQAGGNILILPPAIPGTPITLTLPGTVESFAISNISGSPVTLSYPLGSDFGSTLYSGQKVLLAGDGGGFWRIVVESLAFNGPVKPEWFGARLNDPTADCTSAINTALAVAGWVALSKGIYYCNNGIVMPDYSVLEGPGPIHCSIEIKSPTDHLISCTGVAGASYLGSPRGSNFAVSRSVNPQTPANPGNDNNVAHGIHCFMVSNPIFENVYTYNNLVEVYVSNVLTGRFENIRGIRTLGGGSDRWSGVWVDGIRPGGTFGGPSPNPSLTISRPNMVCGFSPSSGYGIFGNGSLADLWLSQPETAGGNVGIFFDLTGGGGSAGSDVKVTNPVCDGYKDYGVYVKSAPFGSTINIESPYVAGAAGATGSAVRLEASHGVAVTNVQAIGTLNPSVYGAHISDGTENTVTGRFVDYNTALYAISTISCDFDVKAVKNFGAPSATEAMTLISGHRNRAALALQGGSYAWNHGIGIDASASEYLLDVSRIANGITYDRIKRAGTAIVTQGNVVAGHMVINPGLTITT